MSDNVLRSYAMRLAAADSALTADNAEDTDGHHAPFGCVRGGPRERAVMLELRLKNGNIRAVAYSYLTGVNYDPSEGITLRIGDETIRIKGRNLNHGDTLDGQLFSSICRHRVVWLRETTDAERNANARPDGTTIEAIMV